MALRLNEESWIWYALAMALVVCRVLSRTIFFGNLKNLKIDDWLMVVTVAPYTVLLVVINIVAHTSSNLLEPGTNLATMSQEERDERVYGSKLILVVEQMQLVTIWLVKACLIILYHRLTYVCSIDAQRLWLTTGQAQFTCAYVCQDPRGVCWREFRHHGDPVLGRVVSTILELLGPSYAEHPVQRSHKPSYHKRCVQSQQ